MFSSRTGWNLSPNALHQLLDEKRKRSERVLDLTESNPTRCGFTYDPSLLQSLASERSLTYEPEPHGLLSARQAIADYYGHKGVSVAPDALFITASTSEAYSHLFRLLCNAGENVVVPKPSYPLFDYLCALNDVDVRHYRLRYDDEWHLDFDSLREAVDGSTRGILLVHPNNPTGSFIDTAEKKALLRIAREKGIALIADEVFSDFAFNEDRKTAPSFAASEEGLVFTLNGISKLLGLPQMKLAWIVVSGDRGLVHDATERLEIICDTYLSAGTPVQHALPDLFIKGKAVTDQIAKRVRTNFAALHAKIKDTPLSILHTEAGWNCILQLPRFQPDEAWALRLLKESNILVHPGHFFEIEREACLVISLLPPEAVFLEGFDRILGCVSNATHL